MYLLYLPHLHPRLPPAPARLARVAQLPAELGPQPHLLSGPDARSTLSHRTWRCSAVRERPPRRLQEQPSRLSATVAAAAERAAAGGRKPARRFRDCPSWCPVLEGPALLFVESQNLARTARPGLRFSVAARRLRALGACSAGFRHLLLHRHAPAGQAARPAQGVRRQAGEGRRSGGLERPAR